MICPVDPPKSRFIHAKDEAFLEDLHPPLRHAALRHLLLTRQRAEEHKSAFRVHIGQVFRSPEKQIELYRRGRSYDHSERRWRVVDRSRIVTNAQPDKTAHCVTDKDGKPASRAYHITLLEPDRDNLLPDKDPRWAIPTAVLSDLLQAHAFPRIISGAFFSTIPGGDWQHFEQAHWRRELGR